MSSYKYFINGVAAAAALSSLTIGTAKAADYICTAGDFCDFDGESGGVGGVKVAKFGTATDTFKFYLGSTGYFTINIANSKLELLAAQFNNVPFTPENGEDHKFYILSPGFYTLALSVKNPTSKNSAYSINFDFSVPEPAVWGMMIGGFAIAGASLRARRRTVRFA